MCVKKAPVIKQRLFYFENILCLNHYRCKANTFLLDTRGVPFLKRELQE